MLCAELFTLQFIVQFGASVLAPAAGDIQYQMEPDLEPKCQRASLASGKMWVCCAVLQCCAASASHRNVSSLPVVLPHHQHDPRITQGYPRLLHCCGWLTSCAFLLLCFPPNTPRIIHPSPGSDPIQTVGAFFCLMFLSLSLSLHNSSRRDIGGFHDPPVPRAYQRMAQ